MLNPVALRTAVSVPGTITGGPAAMRVVVRGAGDGVTSWPLVCICAVTVITPATVPVCTPTSVLPVVEPAGTVMRAVRPPVEN